MAAPRRHRSREAQLAFEALSIEGGLLSPEWLSKVAQLQAGTQAEADYRIPKGLNLRDEIGRYWRIAQALWAEFKTARDGKADPKLIAERFVTALLRDVFGFVSLAAAPPAVISERTYPIGHAALGGHVPVVIAPTGHDLDSLSSAFGDGTRKRSAFGLVQEYLNAEDNALWGIASDGASLRIVRDNASLTRPAWIEADLQRVFTEERYADFAALWLLCHETRFGRDGQPVAECALETWRNAGREEGTRAREHLRRGVEDALVALGQGFLTHAENQSLRNDLQSGALPVKDYFNQLLRLVYRLIFLLTVEERALLHPDGTSDVAKTLYSQGYSLRRLRERSVKRSAHDRFSDLWEAVKVVCRGLASGEPRLGLPALAGIFAINQCPALDAAKLENRALLLAVFKLAWLREDGSLSRVNWRDMGPEELGSVYESLLELVPQIAKDGREFAFATGGETKGNARKTTGSYYTPDSLVQVLLDSALEPVISDTIAKNPKNPVEALLGLSIVDPACGSGHFLLAAARRLAAHVARLQANGTPSAAEYRHALRQVVGHCIFGVDLNPMAVELCKVGLWMEAVEPGLPLTFLDSHIQQGNALLGTTPELMDKGVPDVAWEPIEGDDKKTASALKKRNKAERSDKNASFEFSAIAEGGTVAIASQVQALDAASDHQLGDLERKQVTWQALLASQQYRARQLAADAWCAAFVWPKPQHPDELTALAPTHQVWERLRHDPQAASPLLVATVQEIACLYNFFHWHLAFPQVLAKGGFDVVLGNPPWERVKLQEQEFFASRNDDIARAPNAVGRKRLIARLPDGDPHLWAEWSAASRKAEGESHFIRQTGRYPLCGKGDVNTYAIFAEHNRSALKSFGRAGFIVPTGIATDDTTKEFFQRIVDSQFLAALFDFENRDGLFPHVARQLKFSLVTLGSTPFADVVFFAYAASDLKDINKHVRLTAADIAAVNPNTRTCPTFRSRRDADINLGMYRRAGILWREADGTNGNAWGVRFLAMLHMAGDSELFKDRRALVATGMHLEANRFVDSRTYLPLIEAKMVHHFDHRYGDYSDRPEEKEGTDTRSLPDVPIDRLLNPHYEPLPRYWVDSAGVFNRHADSWNRGWLLGWRDVSKSYNERTVVASLLPYVAVGHKFPLILPEAPPAAIAHLYACLCSFALDYAARQKVGGTSLTYFILKQLPILSPSTYTVTAVWDRAQTVGEWLLGRILELTYTSWGLEPFARDLGYAGMPFRWNTDRRFKMRCELDAAFFYLYGFARIDIDYVMETFPIVRKNDEKIYGEYRTKRVVLETYDTLAEAAATGRPYRTPLDPLPSAPGASHGIFSPDGTPKDYAEALCLGLLFTFIRRSTEAGIAQSTLSRALLWLQDAKHAASWLEDSALSNFERARDSDPLLAQGASATDVSRLLNLLEHEKVITRDPKGIVRLRVGSAIPNWLPQTPTLARLASAMRVGLERAEGGAGTTPAAKQRTAGRAKPA